MELTAWPALYYCVHLNIQILVQLIEKIWYYIIYLFCFTSNINVPIEQSFKKIFFFSINIFEKSNCAFKKKLFFKEESVKTTMIYDEIKVQFFK